MRIIERLRGALLRWDRLLAAAVLGLPFILAALLGMLWLFEHGALLPFIGLSLGAGLLVVALRWWRDRRGGAAQAGERPDWSVEADPQWSEPEQRVFREVRAHIDALTARAQPWESLPEQALEVVNRVARGLGGEERSALDFTAPEALLLLEHTASRYRDYLRSHLPFSDQVSLASLYWIWRHRGRALLVWRLALGGHRLARLAVNPTAAILREIEQVVAGGNAGYLSEQMLASLQAVLLEEVAFAAVELYSGRLRFSDAELLRIQMAEADADRARLARPDAPLRILLAGQTSSGKSTLLNALLERDLAEADAAPTTAAVAAYEAELEGLPCLFLDSRGLDGSSEGRRALLREMSEADMVVWVLRADRPAREPDLRLKQLFDDWYRERPQRRKPPVIGAATCMDRLAPDWPRSSQRLPEAPREDFARVVNAIAEDMEGLKPHPVCALPPRWNVEAVRAALCARLGEALRVQRNRLRLQGLEEGGRWREEARRGARGVLEGTRVLGGRLAGKPADKERE